MAKEIFTVAGVMWALVLTGLSVGFGLLGLLGGRVALGTGEQLVDELDVRRRVPRQLQVLRLIVVEDPSARRHGYERSRRHPRHTATG